jgi:hypothetical protein
LHVDTLNKIYRWNVTSNTTLCSLYWWWVYYTQATCFGLLQWAIIRLQCQWM